MNRPRRLFALLLPLVVGAAALTPQSRAQTPPSGRFAFADTTLLRDTLNLRFDFLFELSDSLGMLPDTLRALSIRHRLPLRRLVYLADSMRVPVDSVGAILLRERFNPLAAGRDRVTRMIYTSAYDVARNTSGWSNFAELNLQRGPVYLNNRTDIRFDRQQGGGLTLRQTRESDTEGGWKFSPNFSVGARALLVRYDSENPGGINDEDEDKNEFQISSRTRLQPSRSWNADFNAFTGALHVENSTQVKNGVSAIGNGSVRYQRSWLTHDLRANVTGNVSRTRLPTAVSELNTRDGSTNIDGTLAAFTSSPIGLNVTYGLRRVRVEAPLDSNRIQQVRTDEDRMNATLRMRRDNDRYLNVVTRLARTSRASPSSLSSQNQVSSQSVSLQGRYRLLGWFLDASLDAVLTDTRFPQRAATGGYGDDSQSRSFQTNVTRNFGSRVTLRADGRVTLTQSRYYVIGSYPSPPVNRDQYRQSYRIDTQYNRSERLTTGLGLEVVRLHFINLPSASTGANNETRTYRAEWRWTYRLLAGLTATQRNQLNADYLVYDFLPSNNRVSLNYKALTTLNAILTPRTTIELTHDTQFQPSGNYTRFDDGLDYFSKADEGQSYLLRGVFAYAPSPVISLNMRAEYQANARATNTAGGVVPQRDSRSMDFSGGGSLNVPLGARGRITGDLRRSYRADRSISFQNGIAQPSGRSEFDYWNGRLELTWEL